MFVKKKYPSGHIFLHEAHFSSSTYEASPMVPTASEARGRAPCPCSETILCPPLAASTMRRLRTVHAAAWKGQMAEGALYVIFQGSVEFYRAASGTLLPATVGAIKGLVGIRGY